MLLKPEFTGETACIYDFQNRYI